MVNPAETDQSSIDMKSRGVNTKMGTNSINLRYMSILDVNCDLLFLVNFRVEFLDRIKLCNPRTGQIQTLPEPPIDYPYCPDLVSGYVDSTRQYVLVGLFYKQGELTTLKFCFSSNYECECDGDTSCSCSIASSSWKEIEEASPLRLGRSGILVNNSVYWRDYGQEEKVEIVSLELENEKYKIISCPPQFSGFTLTLIDLKGTLAVAVIDTSSLDIWVLDHSHSCGWVKKHSIKMGNILGPYDVYSKSSRNGDLIVTEFSPGLNKHYVCNPEKGSFRALIDPCSCFLGPPSERRWVFSGKVYSPLELMVTNMEEILLLLTSFINMPPFLSLFKNYSFATLL